MGGVARKRYDTLLAKEQQQKKKRNPNANTNGLNEYEVKYHKKKSRIVRDFFILYFTFIILKKLNNVLHLKLPYILFLQQLLPDDKHDPQHRHPQKLLLRWSLKCREH